MTPAGLAAHAHSAHAGHAAGPDWLVLLAAALGIGYVVLALVSAREATGWRAARTASFLAGCVVLALPGLGVLPWPAGSFPEHMANHLLIGMYAPLLLVLGAPVTLLLRRLPRRHGRSLTRLLRTRVARLLAHPVTGLVLTVGGLLVLYLTPLYRMTTAHPALHHLVHAHFLLSGCLFAYAIAGPDPAPHRPSVPYRLVVLGVAIAVHATLAQLLYGGLFVDVPVPDAERKAGADLMYYGGDIAELALALAMVSTWRPERRAQRHPAASLAVQSRFLEDEFRGSGLEL